MKGSGAPIVLLLGAGLFLGVGCNLVADLGSFHPAGSGGSSSSTTISTGGNGGAADQGSSTVATSVGGGSITTSTVGPGSSSSQSTGGNQCSPYVLISEVNINDDYVELWNPTDTLFSLSGATITARGSSGNDTKKWTGLDSDTIDAGQYFVVGSSGMKPPAQAKLSSNLTNSSPTVIVFQDSVGDIIDSVCICSAAGCSYMFEGSTEVCAHPALSADFFLDNNPISAERISCVDTDHGSDFTFDCETPDAPYGSACAPQ